MRNKATKKNMDLDLRRYGNKLYSKAEQSGGSGGGDEGGDSTPTEFYIKFKWKDFGWDDMSNYTPDKTRGYSLNEIFDMSDDSLQRYINEREKSMQEYYEIDQHPSGDDWGTIWKYNGEYNLNSNTIPYYFSLESGTVDGLDQGSGNGTYPRIELGFIGSDGPETFIAIEGSNLMRYSMSVPCMGFKKNPEDGKWYIITYGTI